MSIYLKTGRVKDEWTDYNGHMNLAFYFPMCLLPYLEVAELTIKKPLEVIPRMIPKKRNIYPDKFDINLTCFTKQVNNQNS